LHVCCQQMHPHSNPWQFWELSVWAPAQRKDCTEAQAASVTVRLYGADCVPPWQIALTTGQMCWRRSLKFRSARSERSTYMLLLRGHKVSYSLMQLYTAATVQEQLFNGRVKLRFNGAPQRFRLQEVLIQHYVYALLNCAVRSVQIPRVPLPPHAVQISLV
jgi:hypothetical protein